MKENNFMKQLRLEHNMTQPQIAEEIGVSEDTIYSIESGRRNPGLPIIKGYSKLFNVPMDEIVKRMGL